MGDGLSNTHLRYFLKESNDILDTLDEWNP